MTDIVQQQSISYPQIKQDLINYVVSLNDYSTKWRDYYEGGAGTTIVELIAGMGTYLNLVALKSRREAYIDEAKLSSSITGIGTTLGYPINRATAPQYSLNVNVLNPVTQSKFVSVGTYNNTPVSLIQDTTFNVGANTATVALGTWKTFTVTSTSSATYGRIYIEDVVDNNLYSLFINNQLVSTTTAPELLNGTNVLLRTYFYGLYLIFGDGIFGKLLNVGDVIRFEYFSPAPIILDAALNLTKFTNNIKGTITSGTVLTYGSNSDSDAKIAAVAPGYFTAKRRLITLSDYEYVAYSYNGVVSAGVQKHPGICCTVDLAVIGDGGRNFSTYEKTSLLQYLNGFQVLGTTINIVDVQSISVNVDLLIIVQPTANQGTISATITNYLNTMTLKLGSLFSVNGLLNLPLDGVIRIYPKYPITDYQAAYNQYFKISALNLQFTINATTAQLNGTDPTLGYVVNGSNI